MRTLRSVDLASALSLQTLSGLSEWLGHWWRGDDLLEGTDEGHGAASPATGAAVPATDGSTAPAAPEPNWPESRLAVIQRLFGEGQTSPGGIEGGRAIIKSLGLDSTMSVVDLSGGLGGVGRMIARETGAWVTSIEADPELAAAGMLMSKMAGLAKKAPVMHGDLSHPGVRAKSQNAIIGKERTFVVEDKHALFESLKALLKPAGQITFTDYMLAEAGVGCDALDKWCAVEPVRPHLVDPESHRAILTELGFDVRVVSDITGDFCHRLVGDFAQFADSLKHSPLSPAEKGWVVREARYWLHRVAAIDAGALKVYRVYATLR